MPIIPVISTITRGNWKIRNLRPNDYVLDLNCHLKDIYGNLPDSPAVAKHYKTILADLAPLSRPDESVRQKHIAQILLSRK